MALTVTVHQVLEAWRFADDSDAEDLRRLLAARYEHVLTQHIPDADTGSLLALLDLVPGVERDYGTPDYYRLRRARAAIRKDAEVLLSFGVRLEGEVISIVTPEED